MTHPSLYQINTRVWIKQFGEQASLADIQEDYWDYLRDMGVHIVWMMGIWKTTQEVLVNWDWDPQRMASYSAQAGEELTQEDIIGSPYAIDRYEISPHLGEKQDLIELRKKLNQRGMRLMLDFVPNHYARSTSWLSESPEHFLQVPSDQLGIEAHDGFILENRTFLFGRDPYSGAWLDTVQVDYFREDTREWMVNQLSEIASLCDGVRCDMAMLLLNNVFRNTWGGVDSKSKSSQPQSEFWESAITTIKSIYPDFVFIAEVYWDLEWELQMKGFDYTYDKRLADRLIEGNVDPIQKHLLADITFQNKLVRFLENHDEERAMATLGKEKSMAAATLAFTLPGVRFFYDGQWEGRLRRLPVQMGRFPNESYCTCLTDDQPRKTKYPKDMFCSTVFDFYKKLLATIQTDLFQKGTWRKVDHDIHAHDTVFAWKWVLGDRAALVLVNYSDQEQSCVLNIDRSDQVKDLLHRKQLPLIEVQDHLSKIVLRPYQARILEIGSG